MLCLFCVVIGYTFLLGNCQTTQCSYAIGNSKDLNINCFNSLQNSFTFYVVNQTEINEKCENDSAEKKYIKNCAEKVCNNVKLVDLIKMKGKNLEKINDECLNENSEKLHIETCGENGCDTESLKKILNNSDSVNNPILNTNNETCRDESEIKFKNELVESCGLYDEAKDNLQPQKQLGNFATLTENGNHSYRDHFSKIGETFGLIVNIDKGNVNVICKENSLELSLTLNLQNNRLKSLSTLENFKQLEKIDLSLNQFSSFARSLFENATNLKHFTLKANDGELELPFGFLANKRNLKTVKLNGNKLKKLPAGLFLFSNNIEEIDLSDNELESLPQ